jgi:hypothetical protein
MVVYGGPEITTSGLVLCLDPSNTKSYSGSGTAWNDLSGNGNNPTLFNGVSYDSSNKGALTFDGVNDYAYSPLPTFNLYSMSLWFRPLTLINSSEGFGSLIQFRFGLAANSAWYIALGPATILLTNEYLTLVDVVNNSRIALTDGGNFTANSWHYLTINYTTQYDIYINSQLKTSTRLGTMPLLGSTNRLYVCSLAGDDNTETPRGFANLTVSQILAYNRSLSENEIAQNYNATKGRYGL